MFASERIYRTVAESFERVWRMGLEVEAEREPEIPSSLSPAPSRRCARTAPILCFSTAKTYL
jgi:hypothetical protein